MSWGAGAPDGSVLVGKENPGGEVSLPRSRCQHSPRDGLGRPPAQWPLIRAGVESFGSLGACAGLPAHKILPAQHLPPSTAPLPQPPLSPLLAQAAPARQSLPPPLLLVNLEDKRKLTQERHAAKPKPCCSPCSRPLRKHKASQKKSAAIARSHAVRPPPSFSIANPIPIKNLFLAPPTAL